jgi:hypothetical protein
MENITAWFFKVTNIRLIIGMCMIYLAFPLYLIPSIIDTGSVGPLDLLFWYNHDTLYQMLSNYGSNIRQRYIVGLLSADLSYPIFYGTLLAMLLALIIKKLAISVPNNVIFLPYIVVILDLTENAHLVFLLNAYPIKYAVIADIAGFVTAAKWCGFVMIAMFISYLVISGIRTRRNSPTHR